MREHMRLRDKAPDHAEPACLDPHLDAWLERAHHTAARNEERLARRLERVDQRGDQVRARDGPEERAKANVDQALFAVLGEDRVTKVDDGLLGRLERVQLAAPLVGRELRATTRNPRSAEVLPLSAATHPT